METYVLTNPGLEEIAVQELQEKLSITAELKHNIAFFEAEPSKIAQVARYAQSIRRICAFITTTQEAEDVDVSSFTWKDFFTQNCSFKLVVENVKGQENRIEIARIIAGNIFDTLKKQGINANLEMKQPDFLVNIFWTGKEYVVGIDCTNKELNVRQFRVFPHQASFKGDFAYAMYHYAKSKTGNNVLSVFSKDGVIAIEAALSLNSGSVQQEETAFAYHHFPAFKDVVVENLDKKEVKVFACDETRQNIIAARKNATLANVKSLLEVQRYLHDELDTRFSQKEFDSVICQLTTKDESKINELYYQIDYILKEKGILLFITRSTLELSISEKFTLVEKIPFMIGQSQHVLWKLEKE